MMKTLMMILVVAVCPAVVSAACNDVTDDKQRLACFDSLARCSSAGDAGERLACYDGHPGQPAAALVEAPPVKTPPPTAPAPAPRIKRVDESAPVAERAVDADDKRKADDAVFPLSRNRSDDNASITARITDISRHPYGYKVVTLSNGQVWQEFKQSNIRYAEGDEVTIKEGMFGARFLTLGGKPGKIKVKRIR